MFRRSAQMSAILLAAAWPWAGALAEPKFKVYDPGTEEIVDYEKYGEFRNPGTKDFRYVIRDSEGLAKASGEGIDPSRTITNNPHFVKAKKAGRIKADWWGRVNTSDPELDYFTWANSAEEPGVRLLFVGKSMEKGGNYIHALKAYRAAMILYPDSACWSSGSEFQWDVATASWNAIQNLLRTHPELNIRLVGADVVARAEAGGLNIVMKPGRLVRADEASAEPAPAPAAPEPAAPVEQAVEVQPAPPAADEAAPAETNAAQEEAAETVEASEEPAQSEEPAEPPAETNAAPAAAEAPAGETNAPAVESATPATSAPPVAPDAVIAQRGTGTVQFVQYGNGEWKMLVDGEPYFIRGMNYAPVRVGVKPWEWSWYWSDENTNGVVDSLEVWVDANRNDRQDDGEPVTSDGQLMKDAGINTIKFYLIDSELPSFNHLLMRKMYHDSGIRAIVGNFLGAYCNGSGATWEQGTDYTNRKQRENMKASVSNLVMKLKDEPWVLAWILGNENNMEMSGEVNATRTNGSKYPDTYAWFLNEVAKMIHQLDPNHPVGIGNLLTGLVEFYADSAPQIDFIGINSYLGEEGFGATWQKVRQTMNRPVVITEFGCDSYETDKGPNEEMQSAYLVKNWEDIIFNSAGNPGAGNSVGGFVFEWLDEWWKDTINYFEDSPAHQTTRAVFPMPFPDGYAQEEWFGIVGQGSGHASPFQRVPKKAYFAIQEQWTSHPEAGKGGEGR